MPAKRRRPVVEEIIETPVVEHHSRSKVRVEETVPVETQIEVASYDEPPLLEHIQTPIHAEAEARELLSRDTPPSRGPNMKLIFLVTIVTALIVGFIAGGVYVYVSGVSSNTVAESSPTPSSMPVETTPTSKPSPTPTVVPSSYKVSVLNGSGVIGAAGKVKASLETSGFKVTGTGNAASYNFKNTVLQVKSSVSAATVELVKKALNDYVVEDGETLPVSSTFDIVITAGKE